MGRMESQLNKPMLNEISLADLKRKFSARFPNSQLAQVLLSEPDTLSGAEFLAKAQTWLAILENEKRDEKWQRKEGFF